jgi:hypothetical protein
MDDQTTGLYQKYHVQRVNDPEGKHDGCPYFVLDIRHDPHARIALSTYIQSCGGEYPQLALDLHRMLQAERVQIEDSVYSRDECCFNYCDNPGLCKQMDKCRYSE